jgi:cytochrome bd ubiquinol oxidase subunit I
MAGTLGFHIILACFGIAFPAIVLTAEFIGLRRGDQAALLLARRWSLVLGVLVAVGTVTGTVLSFEMNLLWPGLMRTYGAVLGLPFAVEGIFFLLEAVFTAIYLYGWRRLSPWAHWWSGVPIAVSGVGGAISVVAVNSWMNDPGGFTLTLGKVTQVHPLQVFFNGALWYEGPHMLLAAYLVAGFGTAAVYATGYLRGRRDRYHRLGFAIPFVIAAVLAPVQFLIGDTAARAVASAQPLKFAAMEYVTTTGSHQSEWLGGVYYDGRIYAGIPIPDLDSLLVGFSPGTVVRGLDSVPAALRPPSPTLLHLSFDAMVGIGTFLLLPGLWALIQWVRGRRARRGLLPGHRLFWLLAVIAGPATVVAMECGWIVTEVGRQPWVVYGYLLTADAATRQDVVPVLTAIIVVYAALGAGTAALLLAMSRRWRCGQEFPRTPYVPDAAVQDPVKPA